MCLYVYMCECICFIHPTAKLLYTFCLLVDAVWEESMTVYVEINCLFLNPLSRYIFVF